MGLNVIMMGAPGAGKGTQASRFVRERGLLKISTGDILRDAIKEQLPVALAAKAKMDRGELVDDETMIAIVRDRLFRPDSFPGFVLDGFPRTVVQAQALDRIMDERDHGPLIIVDVVVPEQELVRRLATRRICRTCGQNADPFGPQTVCAKCGGELVQRTDDNQEVVLERLKIYQRSTRPVLDYYRERPTFRMINGAQAPDRVAHEMNTLIDDAAAVGVALKAGSAQERTARKGAAREGAL